MSFMDAQFDRAVEIVQGLPKTGPVGVMLDTIFEGHCSFLFYRYKPTMKRSLQCTGMNRFIYELLPLTRMFLSSLYKQGTLPCSIDVGLSFKPSISNGRECEVTKTCYVGYAWEGEMVCGITLFSAGSEHVPGMHGPNTRI